MLCVGRCSGRGLVLRRREGRRGVEICRAFRLSKQLRDAPLPLNNRSGCKGQTPSQNIEQQPQPQPPPPAAAGSSPPHLCDCLQQPRALDSLPQRQPPHRQHHHVPEEPVEVVLGEHAKAEERDWLGLGLGLVWLWFGMVWCGLAWFGLRWRGRFCWGRCCLRAACWVYPHPYDQVKAAESEDAQQNRGNTMAAKKQGSFQ